MTRRKVYIFFESRFSFEEGKNEWVQSFFVKITIRRPCNLALSTAPCRFGDGDNIHHHIFSWRACKAWCIRAVLAGSFCM